jgi:hypothetical protein
MSSAIAQDYHVRTHGPISERRKLYNEDLHSAHRYNSSWFTQFYWLLKRGFFKTLRDPLMIRIRLIHTILTATCLSIVYFQQAINSNTIINIDGLLFQMTRDSYVIYTSPCILVFTEELIVFLRETHGTIYRTSSYFVSKNVAELPSFFLLPSLYATIIYFATTSASSYRILEYIQTLVVCNVSTFMAVSIGYMAGTIVSIL